MLKLRFSAVSITQISYRHLQIYFDLIFDNDAENVWATEGSRVKTSYICKRIPVESLGATVLKLTN